MLVLVLLDAEEAVLALLAVHSILQPRFYEAGLRVVLRDLLVELGLLQFLGREICSAL